MLKKILYLTTIFSFIFCLFVFIVNAADVTLAWDANSETDLAGYKLYYNTDGPGAAYNGTGIVEGDSPIDMPLSDFVDVDNPQFKVTGLTTGTYYFVVTAYDDSGNESGYSNEVNQTIDTTSPNNPTGLNVTIVVHVQVD